MGHHLVFELFNRVLFPVGLDFFFGPVFGRIAHGVTAVAIRADFQEGGSITGTGAGHGSFHGFVDGPNAHAVHGFGRHSVGKANFMQFHHIGGALNGRAHGVPVILNHKDDREVPKHGHVKGFVQGALSDGPVPHKTNIDIGIAQVFVCKGQASSQGDLTSYNAVAPVKAVLLAKKVHGAAFALGATGGLPVQFGHHRSRT